MNAKEKLKNDIIVEMANYMSKEVLPILEIAIMKSVQNLDIRELETLPATIDNTNDYIINLFMVKKAPKLSENNTHIFDDYLTQGEMMKNQRLKEFRIKGENIELKQKNNELQKRLIRKQLDTVADKYDKLMEKAKIQNNTRFVNFFRRQFDNDKE